MKKLQKLRNQLGSVKKEIDSLKTFRPTKQTGQLLRHLFAENSRIVNAIKKLQLSSESRQKERQQRRQRANLNRRTKMTRGWRFFKAIKENYLPDKSTKEIRSQFSKFKKGLETDIAEVIWRNPSP
ncbi:MAG: hypothetical protein ACREA3_10130 [Nitrosotalea sp.]